MKLVHDPKMLLKPHLSVRVYRPYFRYLEKYYPHFKYREWIASVGLDFALFEDDSNWVSILFDKFFMDEVLRVTGDPDVCFKVGKFAVAPETLGATLSLLGKYGFSLAYFYGNAWRLTKFLNRVAEFKTVDHSEGTVTFSITPIFDGMTPPEKEALKSGFIHIVRNSIGYYAHFPMLKGLKPAKVSLAQEKTSTILTIYFPRDNRILFRGGALLTSVLGAYFFATELLKFNVSQSLMMSLLGGMLVLIMQLKARIKSSENLSQETEKNLRKLDEQYQDLFKTKTHLQRKLTESDAINRVTQNLSRFTSEKEILDSTCGDISKVLGLDRSLIMLRDKRNEFLEFKAGHFEDHNLLDMLQNLKLSVDVSSDDPTKISNVYRFKKPILIADVKSHLPTLNPESQQVLQASGSKSFLAVPIATDAESFGVIMADMVRDHQSLTQEDLELLAVIGKQLAITLAKNRATHEIEEQATSYSRFVPWDLIRLLGAQKIKEIDTGKGVELDLTIVFCDIRGFTSMSEKMSPADSVKFLNSYYTNLAPTFQEHGGVIDKFLGDGIMALFESPSDALRASAEYQRKLADYNEKHRSGGKRSFIKTGFGIHSGKVLLGAIGYKDRLSISVVSDSVNLASRLDGLTKKFGVDVVCTENVLSGPEFTDQTRKIAELKVEGRDSITQIYEFFAHLRPEEQQQRRAAAPSIENILKLLSEEQFEQALQLTEKAVQDFPNDPVVQHYRKRLLAQFVNIEFKIDAA